MRIFIALILLIASGFCTYKMGYLYSEMKFCHMMIKILESLDPNSEACKYNLDLCEMIQKEFEIERE